MAERKMPILVLNEDQDPDVIEIYGVEYPMRRIETLSTVEISKLMRTAKEVKGLDAIEDEAQLKEVDAAVIDVLCMLLKGAKKEVLAKLGFIQRSQIMNSFLVELTISQPSSTPSGSPEPTGDTGSQDSKGFTEVTRAPGG